MPRAYEVSTTVLLYLSPANWYYWSSYYYYCTMTVVLLLYYIRTAVRRWDGAGGGGTSSKQDVYHTILVLGSFVHTHCCYSTGNPVTLPLQVRILLMSVLRAVRVAATGFDGSMA